MPECRRFDLLNNTDNILQVGSNSVDKFRFLFEGADTKHTLVYNNVSSQTYTQQTRDQLSANYDRRHLVVSKQFNGQIIYIEIFNVLAEVLGGLDPSASGPIFNTQTYHDMQFLIVTIGKSFSAGQVTDKHLKFVWPLDWTLEYDGTATQTLLTAHDTAMQTLYQSERVAGSGVLETRFYVCDTDDFTFFGFDTKEGVADNLFHLNAQACIVGNLLYTDNYKSDNIYFNPLVNIPDFTNYSLDISAIFGGSGYFVPDSSIKPNLNDFPALQDNLNDRFSFTLDPTNSNSIQTITNTYRDKSMLYGPALGQVLPYSQTSTQSVAIPYTGHYVVSDTKSVIQCVGLHDVLNPTTLAPEIKPFIREFNSDTTAGYLGYFISTGVNKESAFPLAYTQTSTSQGNLPSLNKSNETVIVVGEGSTI